MLSRLAYTCCLCHINHVHRRHIYDLGDTQKRRVGSLKCWHPDQNSFRSCSACPIWIIRGSFILRLKDWYMCFNVNLPNSLLLELFMTLEEGNLIRWFRTSHLLRFGMSAISACNYCSAYLSLSSLGVSRGRLKCSSCFIFGVNSFIAHFSHFTISLVFFVF